MMYAILAEAIVIAVLWGAWRKKKADFLTAVSALEAVVKERDTLKATRAADVARYEGQLVALRNELSTVYEALNATTTPAGVRDELNRLLSRKS